jgi:hypothetical protein
VVLVVPVRVLRDGLRKKDGAHLSGDGGDLLTIWLERPMDAGALQEWRAVDDCDRREQSSGRAIFSFSFSIKPAHYANIFLCGSHGCGTLWRIIFLVLSTLAMHDDQMVATMAFQEISYRWIICGKTNSS